MSLVHHIDDLAAVYELKHVYLVKYKGYRALVIPWNIAEPSWFDEHLPELKSIDDPVYGNFRECINVECLVGALSKNNYYYELRHCPVPYRDNPYEFNTISTSDERLHNYTDIVRADDITYSKMCKYFSGW